MYFIQKKGWLNREHEFLYKNFKEFRVPKKEYYKNFLVPLFQKLSVKEFTHPDFKNIPFLNGGLFEFQDIEKEVSIPNKVFEPVFEELLERFNFTIREDTEYAQEVAIDPEMLGRIFEELILSVESEKYKDIPDPRRGSGSYYTPRFIVSFMVKQSLLNYLTNELPQIPRSKLKALVWEPLTADIEEPIPVIEKLFNLRIVDPGVGSGAFSVDILNKLVNIMEKLSEKLDNESKKSLNVGKSRYELRKRLIENCIYGVDNQDRAVHLARLRLWLSLIVDLEIEGTNKIPPLLNLDFKIVNGNSLDSKICGFKFDVENPLSGQRKKTPIEIQDLISTFYKLKLQYARAVTITEKKQLRKKIDKTKTAIALWHLENIKKSRKKELGSLATLIDKEKYLKSKNRKEKELESEITDIEKKITEIRNGGEIKGFNWWLDFFEVMGAQGGFDIVIANPPYGVAVEKDIYKDDFELGSRDSYGVFAGLGVSILKSGGTLCYIMSDTWQTIKTHYELRKKLFEETEAQYLISVPMRTFKATVNTGIYLFKKNVGAIRELPDKDNFIMVADFHNLDIKNGDLEAGFDMLIEKDTFDETKDWDTIDSNREFAVYAYRQKLIKRFSNFSFFIASPKLFRLMQDVGNLKPKIYTDEKGRPVLFDFKKQRSLFEQQGPPVYQVDFNDKQIELVKLGDIAEVKQGLATGENNYYLRQLSGTKGSSYRDIDSTLVLKEEELEKIRKDEKIRTDVIKNGICINPNHKTHSDRYFGGRYFVHYDKGGASDIEEGWLPNYYVPTPYFIDWSEEAIKRMKTLTIADVHRRQGNPIPPGREYYKTQTAAVFRNIKTYFKNGITFSDTGYYAPSYRFNASAVYDVMGMSIFPKDTFSSISMLASKISKYFIKNFINSTVHSQVEGVKKIPVIFDISKSANQKLNFLVSSIIQKQSPFYDYMTNEQIEIDRIVYEMYNLDKDDIKEVENWCFRRYPKLAKVIEEKIKRKNNG